MEWITKLERKALEWLKHIPHLPASARSWLGINAWWITLIAAVITGIIALFGFFNTLFLLSVVGTGQGLFFSSAAFVALRLTTAVVSLVFVVLNTALLAMAVTPLKERQKKGWVLLFVSWLVGVVALVVNSVLTLNPFTFIISLLFGALFAAVWGYVLFEIHGQFAHVEKSKGTRAKKQP